MFLLYLALSTSAVGTYHAFQNSANLCDVYLNIRANTRAVDQWHMEWCFPTFIANKFHVRQYIIFTQKREIVIIQI